MIWGFILLQVQQHTSGQHSNIQCAVQHLIPSANIFSSNLYRTTQQLSED
jgi:hypothetical protein